MSSEDFDIVCVNETWLSANVYDAEILHSGYTIVRNDRITRGGGVLLGVKTSTFKFVREIEYKHELEVTVAEITITSNIKMLVCLCYRPPDAEKSWMNKFESFLRDVCTRHSKIVIAGDFNLPRACRQSNVNGFGGNEHAFVKILNDFFLEQMNTCPTREENILDLVITSIPDRIKASEVVKPSDTEISTDHSAIVFNLSLSCNSISKIKRTVFDYHRADFDGLRSHIHSLNLTGLVSDDGDINQDWCSWKNTFLSAVSDFVPTKKLQPRNHLPWMNGEIIHNIKKKNSIRMRMKRSRLPSQNLKDRFRDIRRKIKQMLRESRLNYINSICSVRGQNPKRFWSFFKTKTKVSNIPDKVSMKVSNTERTSSNNDVEIANTFNTYFAFIFTHDSDTDHQQENHSKTDIILDEITLTNDEVIAVLRNLDNNKAHGPDGVPARLLTETAYQIAPSLCALFNKS